MAENLYCPRCAKAFTTDTSYCRTCGLGLDKITGIVRGDEANAPVATTTRPNFNAIRIGLGVFILGLVIGMLNAMLRDFQLFPERYGKAVFFFFIAAGLLSMGAAFIFPQKRYKARKPASDIDAAADSPTQFATAPLQNELPAPDTNEFINPVIDFPANTRKPAMAEPGSVTERTTRNLE